MTPRPTDLLIALLLWASNATGAANCAADGRDVRAEISARGAVRVAHTNDYRPFSFSGNDNVPTGIDVDMAERLAADLGVSLQWVDTTWATLVADLQANRYDIAMSGVSVTAERATAGCFTAAYLLTGKTVLTRCALHRSFDTLAQLDVASVRIIVNPGGTNERFVRDHLSHARLITHGDNRTIFGALAAGDADAMITDAIEARLEARSNPALCVADPPPLLEQIAKAYLIPKDPLWQAWLDAWLARLMSSGDFDLVTLRYLDPSTTTNKPRENVSRAAP